MCRMKVGFNQFLKLTWYKKISLPKTLVNNPYQFRVLKSDELQVSIIEYKLG